MRAIDRIYQAFITEDELAGLLKIGPKSLRDIRSKFVNGKLEFIPFIKPSSKQVLYRVEDVMAYLFNLTPLGDSSLDDETESQT